MGWKSNVDVRYEDYPQYSSEVIDEAVRTYKGLYGVSDCKQINGQKYTFTYILKFVNDWMHYTSMLKKSGKDLSKIRFTNNLK